MTSFIELGVPAVLTGALAELGITTPFPIQAATLPDSLAGRDLLGRGRTGSGKTYAFVLPVVARLAAAPTRPRPGRPRALILAPTRELATQIEATLRPLADAMGLRTLTVFGGVGANPQIAALRKGVDVLVACPGRLDDHIRNGHASLDAVEITVLDEADHMADLGFLPVVRRLLGQTPAGGQRLLFSATLDNGIDVLVKQFMRKPVTHHVDAAAQAPVEMDHHVLHVQPDDRFGVLVDLLAAPGRSVVFTRTKRRAKVLTRQLISAGVPAVELHGNLAQNARNRNLSAFSEGSAPTLVATDIAARGIHVDDVALVIHADPPVEHKAYLHRSGRTARAGARGTVITLMTDDQQADVRDLTRKAGIRPLTRRARPGDALLSELAPGERTFVTPGQHQPGAAVPDVDLDGAAPAGTGRSGRRRGGRRPAATGNASAAGSGTASAARSGTAGAGRGESAGSARGAANGRGRANTAAGSGADRTAAPASGRAAGSGQASGDTGGRRRRGGADAAGGAQRSASGTARAASPAPRNASTSGTPRSSQSRTNRAGTPQPRPASGGGAAAFSARSTGRRGGR
ncbi:RNA helicase [Actinoplanes sp. SE50]|uniref:DEAD/DEAH box helicase n=1 Tax=unclassified Actinoplanes TaxID=2626549 RepID=UPI0009AF6CEA|nr:MULTISPECIES: DEAD/DEAH box helicase [unclassified Actinoplanes]ATO85951.1 RNA helicase [Actinoplanes sp. SE50]SLM03365.1 ATP-dependent RNA helicase RhlE [Actinoplanes sp. SE50/110]